MKPAPGVFVVLQMVMYSVYIGQCEISTVKRRAIEHQWTIDLATLCSDCRRFLIECCGFYIDKIVGGRQSHRMNTLAHEGIQYTLLAGTAMIL